MKIPSAQTLLNYSILILVVSPEWYIHIHSWKHENNLFYHHKGFVCTCAHEVRLHIARTNESKMTTLRPFIYMNG